MHLEKLSKELDLRQGIYSLETVEISGQYLLPLANNKDYNTYPVDLGKRN